MIHFKENFFVNIKIFFETLFQVKWLEKESYIYTLLPRPFKSKKDKKDLVYSIQKNLNKYHGFINDREEYIVYLTSLGTYGSYQKPNKIYTYMNRPAEEIAETIIHEIAHLKIEDGVIKNKLTHDEKEKMVQKTVDSLR